MLSAAAAV
ncbi:hypothetical protein A2U01_0079858, partial [Trifolium medium]|nr:hypothetical protein [Trifolium medium]